MTAEHNTALTYSLHLARRQPLKAIATLMLIGIATVATGYGFRNPVLGLLAAVLLVISVGDFLFPLLFLLTEDGVEVRGMLTRRRISWSEVRSVRRDALGVKLSPLSRRSRLEAYRGIYVWFEGNAEDVMAFIADHMKAEAAGGSDLPSA